MHVPPVDDIEVLPIVVVTRAFLARPSAVPAIRDFVREQLARTALSGDRIRMLGKRVADVLLYAAGEGGTIKVSLRIFADHAEVDLLRDNDREATDALPDRVSIPSQRAPGKTVVPAADRPGEGTSSDRLGEGTSSDRPGEGTSSDRPGEGASSEGPAEAGGRPGLPFAEWLAAALRREGMTMEAASRQLQVSVKTVSRWVSGTTEPRLRDLSRIREVFGDLPPL
jgi:hypothetical protein